MKRLLILAVALAVLLVACASSAEPVGTDAPEAEAATEVYTTMEAATTTQPFVPVQGQVAGITWRTIDLSDDAVLRASLAEELEQHWTWPPPEEQAHGHGVYTLNRRMDEYRFVREIVRRDSGGRETVLLREQCLFGHAYGDCMCWAAPYVIAPLSSRYALISWSAERHAESTILDIQTGREHPIAPPRTLPNENGPVWGWFWQNGRLFGMPRSAYWPVSDVTIRFYVADTSNLPQLTFTNVLAGIAHERTGELGGAILCPNARYFIVSCTSWLSVFDLQQRTVFQLPRADVIDINRQAEDGNWNSAYWSTLSQISLQGNTLYWFTHFTWDANSAMQPYLAVELTLP